VEVTITDRQGVDTRLQVAPLAADDVKRDWYI